MKKYGLLSLVLALLVIFSLGCAKKAVVKPAVGEELVIGEEAAEKEGVAGIEEEVISEEELARQKKIKEQQRWQQEIAEIEAEDIYFDFDKYFISPEAAETLKILAQWLEQNQGVDVLIEGHCDERGTEEYNLALGERRANSAREFLINLGIAPQRLSIISYGEERPVDPRHNEEAWAKNRRAHFEIISY